MHAKIQLHQQIIRKLAKPFFSIRLSKPLNDK